jgi:chromosomal replication initiation ATPase DnaA
MSREAMPAPPRQLALALNHAESLTREDFLPGPSNETALAMIDRWPDWPARVLAVAGPAGSGKSHLASIWACESGARFLSARALELADLPASIATGALVLEDCTGDGIDERALFHLLNLVREEEAWLMLTAQSLPTNWPVTLPDLSSRLRAMPSVSLSGPDDTLLRAVLVKQFADRQLGVDEALIAYLLPRIGRSFADARAAVARLDREALQRSRPVNRALAAELFREAGA